jgi:EsV-1-7 cysteine-rich motif
MTRPKVDNICGKCGTQFANRHNRHRHVKLGKCVEKTLKKEEMQETIDMLGLKVQKLNEDNESRKSSIDDLSKMIIMVSRCMNIDLNEYMADQIAKTDDYHNTAATTTAPPLSSGECLGVKVANNVCTEPGCTTSACYGIKNGKASRCAQHAANGMTNIVSKRCIECDDTIVTKNRYDGRCLRCMVYLFPDQPVCKGYKTKEKHVGNFITEQHISNDIIRSYRITFDKSVTGGSSRRRPDIMLDIGTHVVIIEVDENSHNTKAYCSCDNKRIMELFEDVKRRPMVVIRFNPDKYKDHLGVSHPSCFGRHASLDVPIIKHKIDWEFRLKLLGEQLLEHSSRVPEKEITVMHLFFDGFV